MRFELTTLGTGAALPARGRYPTAQLLNVGERLYLIDCGEGTQERLRTTGANFNRIMRVLISHLHGDHYLGLMGLISSMHLMGRRTELHVHGPPELGDITHLQLKASGTWLRYPLHLHHSRPESGAEVFTDDRVQVTALALKHRIPCTGFVFREHPRPRPLLRDQVHRIPHFQRNAVKAGEDLHLEDGTVVPNTELTHDPPAQRAYAYCSDTAYDPGLVPYLRGVDLLYHEATFTEQLSARARETMHATGRQAGLIAREAGVGTLLLGHFSSRYKSEEPLLREAREVFPNTLAASEGALFPVGPRSMV